MTDAGSVWLFNIQPRNWEQCRDGPPQIDIHGEHVGHPFHGLSETISYLGKDMVEGVIAFVRRTEHGIEGLWEIKETAPVLDQSNHRWISTEGETESYDTYVYCRRIQAFDPPIKSTNHRIIGRDFARFNRGANILTEEYTKKFFEAIRADGALEERTRRRLDVIEAALSSTDSPETREDEGKLVSGTAGSGSSTDRSFTKPSTESTTGQVGSSGGDSLQISKSFRRDILTLYNNTCLLSDIRGSPFVTVAHVIPRSEAPELVEHPDNVLVLCRDLHAAFDAHLFTFDADLRLRVDPAFEPEDEFLKRTLTSRNGEKIEFPEPNGIDVTIDKEFLRSRNEKISWL